MHRDMVTVGIGRSAGSGKTSLLTGFVPQLRKRGLNVDVIANDILTQEDVDMLRERSAGIVPESLVAGVKTGTYPYMGIRGDPSMNLQQIDDFLTDHPELNTVLIESNGDNLAATFSSELANYSLYIISVAEGDDAPRKYGPGVVDRDLFIINETDLAPHIDVDLDMMERDTKAVRGGPFVFTDCRSRTGVEEVPTYVCEGVLFV